MKKISSFIFALFISFLIFLSITAQAQAVKYELIPPSGQLVRGQNIQFTINIDTEGTTVSSTQIGMTYQTSVLQYISIAPGSAMSTVSVTPLDGGRLLLNGSNASSFSGKGVFAIVTFQIIASEPGSTQLCALYIPEPTLPRSQPTYALQPTGLPRSGGEENTAQGIIMGTLFLAGATGLYLYSRKNKYHSHSSHPRPKKQHTIHH